MNGKVREINCFTNAIFFTKQPNINDSEVHDSHLLTKGMILVIYRLFSDPYLPYRVFVSLRRNEYENR